MPRQKPQFDAEKAKQTIEKGSRCRWWRRRGSMKRGFFYTDVAGKRITAETQLERISSLVIPPAWRHVRISPSLRSRIQAVGIDTTGRVQYLYHPTFAERKQREKFSRIEEFGRHLPRLRALTNEHIALEGFPREKVLAVMIRLINSLYFRLGTEKSAHHYRTYGITTLKNKHLEIRRKGQLVFDFVGKSHIQHRKVLVDEELAALMKEIKEFGRVGKLFHYLDEEGRARPVTPADLNNYLKEITSNEFSSKDFRTWGGTLLAAVELAELGAAEDDKQLKKNILHAVRKVGELLGNTPTVARSSYIHPTILKSYEKGVTIDEFRPKKQRRIKRLEKEYEPEEIALLRLFKKSS